MAWNMTINTSYERWQYDNLSCGERNLPWPQEDLITLCRVWWSSLIQPTVPGLITPRWCGIPDSEWAWALRRCQGRACHRWCAAKTSARIPAMGSHPTARRKLVWSGSTPWRTPPISPNDKPHIPPNPIYPRKSLQFFSKNYGEFSARWRVSPQWRASNVC